MNIQKSQLFFRIANFIQQYQLIAPHTRIVIGLSGGPDSVFLMHALNHLHKKELLVAAHLDHQWRAESAQDALVCQQWAMQLGIPFVSTTADNLCLPHKYPADMILKEKKLNGSREDLGRLLRQTFLQQVRNEYQADFIAVAHHQQDQQETFFMRLARGSTLTGLCCMKPKQGVYIRPLLSLHKQDILDYLAQQQIPYLIDATNIDYTYTRNRFRHLVLPVIHAADARFSSKFDHTMQSLQETELFLEQLTQTTFKSILHTETPLYTVDLHKLLVLPLYMQRRVIMHWLITEQVPFYPSTAFLQEIIRFLQAHKSTQHQLGPSWYIKKKSSCVSIHYRPLSFSSNLLPIDKKM